MRPVTSLAEPEVNGTIMRIGFDGHLSCAGVAPAASPSAISSDAAAMTSEALISILQSLLTCAIALCQLIFSCHEFTRKLPPAVMLPSSDALLTCRFAGATI